MQKWAESDKPPSGGEFGEWLFATEGKFAQPEIDNQDVDSLTPGAFQRAWRTPCEFPACPVEATDDALHEYQQKLKPGTVFSSNEFNESRTISAEISEDQSALIVLCGLGDDAIKPWANARVTIVNEQFCHENLTSCFTLEGARKQHCLALGRSWIGEDTFDDFT